MKGLVVLLVLEQSGAVGRDGRGRVDSGLGRCLGRCEAGEAVASGASPVVDLAVAGLRDLSIIVYK